MMLIGNTTKITVKLAWPMMTLWPKCLVLTSHPVKIGKCPHQLDSNNTPSSNTAPRIDPVSRLSINWWTTTRAVEPSNPNLGKIQLYWKISPTRAFNLLKTHITQRTAPMRSFLRVSTNPHCSVREAVKNHNYTVSRIEGVEISYATVISSHQKVLKSALKKSGCL